MLKWFRRRPRPALPRGRWVQGHLIGDPTLVHTSAESFDRDHRIGAMLVGPDGRKITERAPLPPSLQYSNPASVSVFGRELPEGHPRRTRSEHQAESEQSLIRDYGATPWIEGQLWRDRGRADGQ